MVAAFGRGQCAGKAFGFGQLELSRRQTHVAEVLTEEWRMAPAALELAWFAEEVDSMDRELEALQTRLAQLEAK